MRRTTTATGAKRESSAGHLLPEHQRLFEHRTGVHNWKRWGPYVSDRAWGTVREDYSADGSAWTFLTHDMARSKAYRWGEDGIAGWCDERQTLCFSVALWNEVDAILKERYFGLTGPEGNHGEDVKELYYYLDGTPTHSYMKMLYKYPQAAFPYDKLRETNVGRGGFDPEYELTDTGVFNEGRYWDVFVEYAKAGPEETCVRITAYNRGPEAAFLHLLPQVWFRNDWAWGASRGEEPLIERRTCVEDKWCELACRHKALGERFVYVAATDDDMPALLFTNNETNSAKLYNVQNIKPYVKDAFHEHVVRQKANCVNPLNKGTKAAAWYTGEVQPGACITVKVILTDQRRDDKPFAQFDATFKARIAEANEFYESIHPAGLTPEERRVQRQAFAGMLWSKMFYLFDVRTWQDGDNPKSPPPKARKRGRNKDWRNLAVADVISMPDKWEYPWFAAWDWAFHVVPLAMIDIDFAKEQLELLVSEKLQHPNGQIPAYEWEFSDVNPPVQAWAVWRVYNVEKHANGEHGDREFLERCFHKLLLNFTWWVNRKDSAGRNVFQGGFLGLDNISVFDRSQPLPGGGYVEQADATGWMGLFCLNLMAIGLELAQEDPVYEHLGIKFFEHFTAISAAMNTELAPGVKLWDEADGWYYDVAHGIDGRTSARQLKVRSQVGLVPLFACQVLEHSWFEKLPAFKARYEWLLTHRPELNAGIVCVWTPEGNKCLLSIVNYERLKRILRRTLDEEEFLSPFGVRSLSRYHLANPYVLAADNREWTVRYEPAESAVRIYGGNSNWRGPIWFPTAFMLITALRVYDRFFAEGTEIECPTGSGKTMTLNEIAIELGRRMCALFLPDRDGRRPAFDEHDLMQRDPHFRDCLLFYEFFNGDTGAGLGASHQTGWTGLVAKLLEQQAVHRRPAAAGSKTVHELTRMGHE